MLYNMNFSFPLGSSTALTQMTWKIKIDQLPVVISAQQMEDLVAGCLLLPVELCTSKSVMVDV